MPIENVKNISKLGVIHGHLTILSILWQANFVIILINIIINLVIKTCIMVCSHGNMNSL